MAMVKKRYFSRTYEAINFIFILQFSVFIFVACFNSIDRKLPLNCCWHITDACTDLFSEKCELINRVTNHKVKLKIKIAYFIRFMTDKSFKYKIYLEHLKVIY